MRHNFLSLTLAIALTHPACGADNSTASATPPVAPTEISPEQPDNMKIRLRIEDKVITATLIDSKTTQDFISLLPLAFPAILRDPLTQQQKFNMEIKRIGSQPSGKGPAEYFTGTVRIDPLFQANDPARALGATVTFEPGARTAWHTHPLGQTLIVTAGCGLARRCGGPIEEIRPGDVIWFPPGEKHWHGATPTTAMTHIAIQEALDGKLVDWMEKVSDEQYQPD
jgi:quercetin dioxygenase-like cupin family protein